MFDGENLWLIESSSAVSYTAQPQKYDYELCASMSVGADVDVKDEENGLSTAAISC